MQNNGLNKKKRKKNKPTTVRQSKLNSDYHQIAKMVSIVYLKVVLGICPLQLALFTDKRLFKTPNLYIRYSGMYHRVEYK